MFDDMGSGFLFSSLLIGTVGLGMLVYGKKSDQPLCLLSGLVMCVFPYFVHSLILMWFMAGVFTIGTYGVSRVV